MNALTDYETGLVGAVLAAAESGRDLLAELGSGTLTPCFHTPGVREMFALCVELHQDGTPLTLEHLAQAARIKRLEVAGSTLVEWTYRASEWATSGLPSIAESYAQKLRAHHAQWEVARLGTAIAYEAQESQGSVDQWLPPYLGQLAGALELLTPPRGFPDDVVDTMSELDALADGHSTAYIPTGISDFDRRFGGLPIGLLTVVAGRPGMGKTALALSWISSLIAGGCRVGFASCEMSKAQVITRLLAMRGGVPLWRCVQGATNREDRVRLHEAAAALRDAPLDIDDQAHTWPEILGLWERWVARGARCVVVDYLGLVQYPAKMERWAAVAQMTIAAARFARRHQVAVVLLVQLTRDSVRDKDKRPELWHLRESGATEQDAAAVVMVHRPAYYSDTQPAQLAELYLRKNRMGATGMSRAHWDKDRAMFRESETYELREDY